MNPKTRHLIALRLVGSVACGGILTATSLFAQPVAPPANNPSTPSSSTAPATTTSEQGEDTVVLSPFQVEASADEVGYYASNTLSGTRLNTRIEDLASSITIVTKQQMSDFAMLDINDIFNYEVSTEGTGNYTEFSVDRNGMVTDSIQNNPQGANRIRGGGAANIALDNFGTSGRVPIDPINIEAVEISRGPNSNIFGLGEGSGTVNLISATANLNRPMTSWEMRIDDIGGYRTSLDASRPIVPGVLAVRASAVYQQDEFRQKPSGFTTRRLNLMLNAKPWENTSLRVSYQSYHASGTRPSSITPRDTVTYWRSLGSPTWNPAANAVTVNGVTTVMSGNSNPTGLVNSSFQARPSLFIDEGGIGLWTVNRLPSATVTAIVAPNNTGGQIRFLETTPEPLRNSGHPLYTTTRGINDKSILDWENINLAAINTINDRVGTTTVQLEQFFLNSARHKLAMQVAWNREDAQRANKNVVGQSSATGNSNYLYVDINSTLLDGSPNPWFMQPYLGVGAPVTSENPYLRDSYRGQLAYVLDFSREDNWTRWIGRHQFLAYGEYRDTQQTRYRFRDVVISDHPFNNGRPKGNQSGVTSHISGRGYFRYYVGDAQGQNVDHAPHGFEYGNYPFNWYNPETSSWAADTVTLGRSAVQEGSGGTFGSRNLIKTNGLVMQNYLLKDRVVLTAGWRKDTTTSRYTAPSVLLPNFYEFDYAAMEGYVGDWLSREGSTKTKGIVVKPLRWLNMHYNESDSFVPASPAINIQGGQLPNPSSNGKDYGFSVSLWDGRLVLRANRYENNQINSRGGQSATFANRALRMDFENFAGNNDSQSLQRQARNWVEATNPGIDPAIRDTMVLEIMGISPELEQRFLSNTISDTEDRISKGDEYELNWNPDSMVTVKLNVARQESFNGAITPGIVAWVAERTQVWTTIIDPRTGTNWYTQRYSGEEPVLTETGGSTAQNFINGNVIAPINLGRATEGKSRPQIREWRANLSANVRLAKFTDNEYLKNLNVGGALRWEDKGAIGYYGIPINGDITIATEYDGNRPIYDKAHTYIDLFFAYNTRIFDDKIRARFQLNIRNLQESGELRPVGAFPDGDPHTFRIIDPRVFIFTASFSM